MLGVVLAGGSSRRFGSDKAEMDFEGEPLWRRQLRVLRHAGADRTVLVRRPDQLAPPAVACWRDRRSGIGPIAGLQAALAPRFAPFVAILAVDMPGIDAAWFRRLHGFCRPGTGAMVRHADACEPLAAIYPAEALAELNRRLARRDHSLQRLALALAAAGRMTLLPLSAAETQHTVSINTRTAFQISLRRRASGQETARRMPAFSGQETG